MTKHREYGDLTGIVSNDHIVPPGREKTTWTGEGDGKTWTDPKNWTNGIPREGVDVVVNAAPNPTPIDTERESLEYLKSTGFLSH